MTLGPCRIIVCTTLRVGSWPYPQILDLGYTAWRRQALIQTMSDKEKSFITLPTGESRYINGAMTLHRNDTQHNRTQHNDTQHDRLYYSSMAGLLSVRILALC